MNAFKTAIGSLLTGLAGTWHLTKAEASMLKSLAARTAARVKGIRRAPGSVMAPFWRHHQWKDSMPTQCASNACICTDCVDTLQGGKFNHPENCNDNEATGLVAFSPGEMDRQTLWPPPEEVCVLEMGNAIRKLVRDSTTCIGEKLTVQSGLDGESRKQKRLERGRKEFRKQHTAMTRTESTSRFSV